jgi:hypothetical protein
LLVRKVCVTFQGAGCDPNFHFPIEVRGNNPQPSTFVLTPDTSGSSQQLVTLDPGTFTIVESAPFSIVSTTFSDDCKQTAPGSREATGTISAGQHLTCTITNTITQD